MKREDFQEFMQHCRPIKKLSRDRTLIQIDETGEFIVMKSIEVHPHAPSCTLLQALEQQKQLFHEHLLTVIDYCQISGQEIEVFTEYSTHSLCEEYQARRRAGNDFSSEELENILLSVVKALKYLQEKSVGHGCISLRDCLISENGLIKLVDPSMASSSPFHLLPAYFYSPELLAHNHRTSIVQTHSPSLSPSLNPSLSPSLNPSLSPSLNPSLSPSLSLQQSQSDFFPERSPSQEGLDIDFFKNDIFCLGMMILDLGLPPRTSPLAQTSITYTSGTIQFQVLEEMLNIFEETHGEALTSLLSQMLQEQPGSRASVKQVLHTVENQLFGEFLPEGSSSVHPRNISSNTGISSYYYDYDGNSDCMGDSAYHHTVRSFALHSRHRPSLSREEGQAINRGGRRQEDCFGQVWQVDSLTASCKSSRESILQKPLSLLFKGKRSQKEADREASSSSQIASSNISDNFSVHNYPSPTLHRNLNSKGHKQPLIKIDDSLLL